MSDMQRVTGQCDNRDGDPDVSLLLKCVKCTKSRSFVELSFVQSVCLLQTTGVLPIVEIGLVLVRGNGIRRGSERFVLFGWD
jgi:hypothetical protein